jgi:hypothetical protein
MTRENLLRIVEKYELMGCGKPLRHLRWSTVRLHFSEFC